MGLFDKKDKIKEATAKVVAEKTEAKSESIKQGVYGVLISPLISEKSTREEQHGKYAFAVAAGATKREIGRAVATRYGVKPIKINVQNRLGKTKRTGRTMGKRKDWRKAVVTLAKGKSINVYETNK